MEIFNAQFSCRKNIAALGAESAGNFSVFHKNRIYFSKNFGDLLDDANFREYKSELSAFLKKNKIKPDVILTDLHPLYKTTELGKELVKKHKAKFFQIQHHIAHIFSAVGDRIARDAEYKMPDTVCGIALDGTGYGLDGKIWGGEVFKISNFQFPISKQITNSKLQIQRIGHLENQTLIGGDLAVKEPARMLISILSKFLSRASVCQYAEKFYTRREVKLLYNQLQQNFNCRETSSAGRILDAVSVLLGFCGNQRNYKHEPIKLLEDNSAAPYYIKPVIKKTVNRQPSTVKYEILTVPLFKYLIKNLRRDKRRLAAAAQLYVAKGICEIIKKCNPEILKCHSELDSESNKSNTNNPRFRGNNIFIAGGISSNKIISKYWETKGAYAAKRIPRGDAGISLGQTMFYLINEE